MGGSRRAKKCTPLHLGMSGRASILGAGIEIQDVAVQQMSDYCLSTKCMKNYQRRINVMIAWIKTKYPENYKKGNSSSYCAAKGGSQFAFL
jgi:hypothetical protein